MLARTMGDSDTECSYSPTECDSPILYTGAEGILGKEQGVEYNDVFSSVPIAQQELVESFVESQFQPPETQFMSSQIMGTLDALAGLDSMLDHPVPLFGRTPSTTLIGKSAAPKQLTRANTQPNAKVRSLDLILAKISTSTSLDKYTLASKLDAQDLKLLINTCGEVVSSKATKSTMIDRLMQLIECGTWDKVFRSVNAVSTQRPMQSESQQMDTCTVTDTQAVRPPAHRTLSLPLLPPRTPHTHPTQHNLPATKPPYSLQRALSTSSATAGAQSAASHSVTTKGNHHGSNIGLDLSVPSSADPTIKNTLGGVQSSTAVVVMAGEHGDSADWAPVTDATLLNELNGSDSSAINGAVSAAPVPAAPVQFSGHGASMSTKKGTRGGAFFAEQPNSAWQSCDADTQHLLEENDSSLQFRRMLQRLERSTAGSFSGINLSRVLEPASPPPADDVNEINTGSTGESAVGQAGKSNLLDSLRAKLMTIVASGTHTGTIATTSSSPAPVSGAGAASYRDPAAPPASTIVSPPVAPSYAASSLQAPSLWSTFDFDALKLVVFRQDKLGLSLVKHVGVSGVERVVIQSKNAVVLDPRADRLLNVGDELVCVQGASLQTISREFTNNGSNDSGGRGGTCSSAGNRSAIDGSSFNYKESSVGINFNAVMECLKQTPRPLQLGFAPPTGK